MSRSLFSRYVSAVFIVVIAAACSPSNENSLLSDKKDESSSLSVNLTPKSEELYLKTDASSFTLAAGTTKLEVSGECYLSTYPKHQIIAKNSSGAQIGITDIAVATDNTLTNTAKCRNGRFIFSINTGVAPYSASGTYKVRILLQAFDGLGALVTNEAQGAVDISLSR